MADTKLTGLSLITEVASGNLLYVATSPDASGSKAITVANFEKSADKVCIGYVNGTTTITGDSNKLVLKLTMTNTVPGIYYVEARTWLKTMISGNTSLQYSTNDSSYSNVTGDYYLPTHDLGGGRFRHFFGYVNSTVSGTIYFRLYHGYEGYTVEYNEYTDARFGTHILAMRVGSA